MLTVRTDLAVEAHALWRESAGETTRLKGVAAREEQAEGMTVTRVEILDQEGARALGKPEGTYLTLDVSPLWRREEDAFPRVVRAVAALLGPLLPEEGPVLAAGLPGMRSVAGLGAGVLGTTGMEVAEWVRGAAEQVGPAAVIVVDALAARDLERLCATVQIADTGLVPGSGVGNHRMALNRETLGVPVISVGVPTVVDAETIARDLLGEAGAVPKALNGRGRRFFVTPESIDQKIRDLSKVLGYGINLALQESLALEDLEALLA